jgi:hypothetical protein
MDILTSSWLVLTKETNDILSILGIFLVGAGIVFLWLKSFFKDSLTLGEYFVLSLSGALLPLSLGIFITLLFNFLHFVKINFLVLFWLIFILSCFAVYRIFRKNRHRTLDPDSTPFFSAIFAHDHQIIPAMILILIFIASVYIRLAFISGLITPLYFDSAAHYTIIKGLISKIETSMLGEIGSLVAGYYHLGYHAIIASLNLALHMDINNAMLIFGQVILTIIPLPLFFIVMQETKMDMPGIFAVLLAGWGWSMPAHSLNWGKYPALTSILPFELFLCSLYLIMRSPKPYRWILACLSGFCLLISTFIHTRSLVLIIIAVVSSALGVAWVRRPKFTRAIVLGLTGIALAALIFVIQSKPVLSLAFRPYREDGLWMVLLVLLLFPFAIKKIPVAAFSVALSLILLLGSLFIPINQLVPGYDVQTLLDRPYIEMILFFPLAFLGGLGCAGLIKTLSDFGIFQGTRQIWVNSLITLLLFGALAINTTQYKFFPSTCCQFFGEDDAVALDWMNTNLPLNAKIAISSSEMFILETESPTSSSGTDGGIWISPLIHRDPFYMNNQTDFSQQGTLNSLCKNKITHIYIGESKESFDLLQLEEQPSWYKMLLDLPKAQVFKITGCQ